MSGAGTLGPDLSDVYRKYQDRALTLFLKHPCFLREPEMSAAGYLTPTESFAIKAYLRQASLSKLDQPMAATAPPPITPLPQVEAKPVGSEKGAQ
jgi:hypothetical protein